MEAEKAMKGRIGLGRVHWILSVFFYFYIKKTKFQKYMPNKENFKNECLSLIQLETGPKCKKKLHLGPSAEGVLNSELVKLI